jgi:hypothetical protein
MIHRNQLIQLGIINGIFLLFLALTYAYIEVGNVPVGADEYAIMQLTALINVGSIACILAVLWYIKPGSVDLWGNGG